MNLKKVSSIIIVILLFLVLFNCNDNGVNPIASNQTFENVNVTNFEILKVPYEELPINMLPLADLENTPHPKDSAGIQVFYYNGESYYHPTLLTMQMSWYVDGFIQSNDSIYFNTIITYYNKLTEIWEEDENTIWFPYPFSYPIHGYVDEIMEAPWYSAMAQGTLLKILSQLHKLTGDEKYLNEAKKVFKTFDALLGSSEMWITYLDSENYLWFEEYPNRQRPNNTLNGFIYAMFGIYEYFTIADDEHAKFLLQAGLTTLKHYLTEFRVNGDMSYYCLSHKVQSKYYHILHIKQIRTLYAYSEDSYFSDMADLLYYDYN